jgi:hypothetical protein
MFRDLRKRVHNEAQRKMRRTNFIKREKSVLLIKYRFPLLIFLCASL